jgi:eukaryotic-like serine/threonine-protein kinase
MRAQPRSNVAYFGPFQLDLKAGELHHDGRSVRLQEQPFQVLKMLLELPGEVVTRDEMRRTLWPNDTIVEFDQSINAAIKKLRLALQDSAEEPRYVGTVARRGYRLLLPVEWIEASPADLQPAVSIARSPGVESTASYLIGKKVSHYRVLEILGGGGMGVVYKAEDLKLGRRVALKFLPEELAHDAAAMGRLEREARAASALNHPNICTIHGVDENADLPFIVMELLEGQTLRELISSMEAPPPGTRAKKEFLPLRRLLDVAIQIAEGLDAAHKKGIIHRDIKPANIFLTVNEHVKILDFGVAKLQESEDQQPMASGAQPSKQEWSSQLTLTRTGSAIGTAGYMSPEQIKGEKLDARTDLFSFGLVLYEIAAGQRALTGETASILQEAILSHTPTPVRQLNPEVPPRLEQIIGKALEKDRSVRYQSATEMLADLRDLRESGRYSPFRAAMQERQRLLSLISAFAIVVASVSVYFYLHQPPPRGTTGSDTAVLADFANTTGETVFDSTLKQALAIQLEQSPFLNVLSDQRVSATLKLMNRRPNERLTQQVAREICLRSNSNRLVVGSIDGGGSHYKIELKALNCETADTLGSAQAEAENREDVLKALSAVSNKLRRKLGESLASVEKFSKPLAEATTSSLEALSSYTQGQEILRDTGSAEAIPYYKRAVELDPDFARAYVALGVAYGNLNLGKIADENLEKACQLRDRVAGRERFSIEADACGGGDSKKEIEAYTEWIQAYPSDAIPHLNLGNRFTQLGQLEKGAAETREYLRLAPDSVLGYGNLIENYLSLDRFDEAKAALEHAQARKLDGFYLRVARYFLALAEGDDAAMQEQVAWATGKPGAEDLMLSAESDTHAYHGRLREARSFSRRAVESARKAGAKDAAAGWQVNAALREAEFGNPVQARRAVGDALVLAPGQNVEFRALALARVGDATQAQKLADKINHDFPSKTVLQVYWLPTIYAAVELDRGNGQRAIELLNQASAYDLGGLGPSQCNTMYPVYLRGLAYIKVGQSDQAAEQFQSILDHRGLIANFPLGALAQLQLARARTLGGDSAGARTAYQDFLTLWKDADPDIPILKEAKAEYAKLQ